jgi:catalase-peroxidase
VGERGCNARNAQKVRALAVTYATDDAEEAFVTAFVASWSKVMNLDRFGLVSIGVGN